MQPTATWHVATETDGETTDYIVEDGCYRRIATPWNGRDYRTAALIAAAPDLLAALEAWTYKNNAGLPYEERLRLTFAAIAKATGGDQ